MAVWKVASGIHAVDHYDLQCAGITVTGRKQPAGCTSEWNDEAGGACLRDDVDEYRYWIEHWKHRHLRIYARQYHQ